MNHVFLIGFMGAGKSTVGPKLGKLLDLPFVDLDDRIASEQGRSIPDIFAEDGETHFRVLEREALETLSQEPAAVVACGGGIVTVPHTVRRLRQLGTVVYLRTTVAETLARISDRSSRPLISGPDAEERAAELLETRSPLYSAAASIEVDTIGRTPSVLAEQIAGLVREASRAMKPSVVKVPVGGAVYEVVIGAGVLEDVGELVRMVAQNARHVAIVTDSNVVDLFGLTVERKLIDAGFDVHPLSIPAGEASKSWTVAGEVLEALAELRLDRDDLVLALGGGVVGDLGGFAAATYLRGVSFVQVPTTLLAQVDSSVGGKTGVDLRAGKNLAGAFKQPRLVIADTSTLSLLPEREWVSGLAEIAKSAAIEGEGFLGWLEENAPALLARDDAVVKEAVSRSVEFKSTVVSADETEAGPRECLNYGHTFGHALEKVAGYGLVPHGLAVAEGMRFAARLSVEAGQASMEFVLRQDALLDDLGLPAMETSVAPDELLQAMHSDKKARGGHVRFVLLDEPGVWGCRPVAEAMIREHLVAWAKSKSGGLG
jgi:3-dehydroquinate synthase